MSSLLRSASFAGLAAFGMIAVAWAGPDQLAPKGPGLTLKQAEADYLRARLARVEAEILLDLYPAATLKQDLAVLEGEHTLAKSMLTRAQDRLKWSDQMSKRGYLSRSQNDADRLDLERATFTLEQAETKLEIRKKTGKPKSLEQLRKDVDAARVVEQAKRAAYRKEGGQDAD